MFQKKSLLFLFVVILISLLIVNSNFQPVFATEIFSDGFESGDFSAWDGTEGTGTISVASDYAKQGTYSCKAVVDADEYVRAYKNFGDQNVVYARIYVRFDNLIQTDWRKTMFIALRDANTGITLLGVRIYHTTPYWQIYYRSAGSGYTANVATDPPTADEWRCIEIKVDCSTSDDQTDGSYEVWVDGTSVWSETNVDTDATSVDLLRVGAVENNDQATNTIWVDSVVVADTYIGLISGDTTPPTYSDVGTNTTIAGDPCLFHVKWIDDTELDGYIFGTNNTGTWQNDTWTAWSNGLTTAWSNITKTLNSTAHIVIAWRIWVNDTSDNWNDTGIQTLTTTLFVQHVLNVVVTLNSIISRQISVQEMMPAVASLSTITEKTLSLFRTQTQSAVLSAMSSVFQSAQRSISTSLSVLTTITRWISTAVSNTASLVINTVVSTGFQVYQYSLSVILNIATTVARIGGTVTTKGFVLAFIFIVAFIFGLPLILILIKVRK